ncbi:uncharacterized protein N0V96_006266 [Colletotrichum fioriniae]|uniref:uncharacterized protein n=1 Tax=Colletotrichum fioriniae TaxID=710243 RepID=UPI0032DBD604|nr:hypothetical protein N0V96_006266 [Colletotrichum fioriniae]
MSSWTDRIDHLAEHFKDGKTMADWHGDWGFDDNVLNMVENSVQPYLIHMERNSPWPFTTKQGVPETPPNAYELIKLELEHFSAEHQNTKDEIPTNAELLINGKACIFEACGLEEQLQSYVEISKLIEPQISDEELQREACNIVDRIEASSPNPSEIFTNFLFSIINGSSHWLAAFRHRTGLSPSEASNAIPPSNVSEAVLGSIAAEAGLEFSGGEPFFRKHT